MKLLVQPGDGITSLVKGITSAKSSVDIVVFRFDLREVERALSRAVSRGVAVRALIAHTNRAGEEALRKLELRLLGAGIQVARTADDLARYHGKLMIVDNRELYLLAFNFTYSDVEHSRSFGLITRGRDVVREAAKLFEADTKRVPYEPGVDRLLVSPLNARKQLAAFLKGARRELLIYDPKVSDAAMVRLLAERAAVGVNIRIIGRLTRKVKGIEARKLTGFRLHTRTIIRDRKSAFMGSQSLREIELDARREVGMIFRDAKIIERLQRTFEEDWAQSDRRDEQAEGAVPASRIAKKVAKALTRELPAVAPLLDNAVKELVGSAEELRLNHEEVEADLKDAVKNAVKEVVRDVVEEAVEQREGAPR